MNLAQLYYFRTLAKFEHYGKAAEALYITPVSYTHLTLPTNSLV